MAHASVRTKKAIKRKQKKSETVKVKQTASFFTMLKNFVKTIQVFLGFYSFFNIVFWLAFVTNFVDKKGIYIIFKPAWDIVNTFYTYKPSPDDKDAIDFTGVVCSICIMIIVIILKSLHEYFGELEENAKIEDAKRLEKAKKRAIAEEKGIISKKKTVDKTKEAGFLFLLDIDIKQVAGFLQANPLSPEDMVKMKNQFFKALLNNLNLNQVAQKGYYKKRLFLNYKSIIDFDDFIFYTKETLNAMAQEFLRPSIRIDFLVGMTLMKLTDDLKDNLDVLDTVNKLGLKNEFICTQKLKDIYECIPKQTYKMVSKGVYNLSKNLNVSNNQEIYSLRED
ncbi:hypothetical protein IJG14_00340 [bacterium]|nr:hypothetical protein [bacterium]